MSLMCFLLWVCVHDVCVCVCVCVCVFTTVCVHLDGLNLAQIQSMGHHAWPHVTSLSLFQIFVLVNYNNPDNNDSIFFINIKIITITNVHVLFVLIAPVVLNFILTPVDLNV